MVVKEMNHAIQKLKGFLFKDIKSKKLLYLKASLFAVLGMLSVVIILSMHPSWVIGLLLLIAIWSFCRLYYFFFYVIDKYIDPGSRHAGLIDFLKGRIKRIR